MRLVTASEMREMDRISIDEAGIPGVVLMENAGRNAAKIFLDFYNPPRGSSIIILCGRGNNGGDGYVIARYLLERGMAVKVAIIGKMDDISGDALTNLRIIQHLGIDITEVIDDDTWTVFSKGLQTADYIVDGLLGTGLHSPVRGSYKTVIDDVNRSGKPLMAIDIPSGLNADNGQVLGAAIKADLTVTFGYPKPGQLIFPGNELVGRLDCIDIGIPAMVADRLETSCCLTEPDDFGEFLGITKKDIHKGSRGHLLILAGSRGKTGAAVLAATGALKTGAGLVTVGVPKSLNNVMEGKLTEAMTAPLPETDDQSLAIRAKDAIFDLLKGKSALAIGPGLSTNPETVNLVGEILKKCDLPVVVDADALNAIALRPEYLESLDEKKVLTPHPGEMGRLAGMANNLVQADRIKISREYAEKWGCYLVLKGARTVMAEPDGMVYINPTGNPALASGGTGDVLTGMISGLITRGLPVSKAIIGAVYLHGLAADYLAEQQGEVGLLAGELMNVIPFLMDAALKGKQPLKRNNPFSDFFGIL